MASTKGVSKIANREISTEPSAKSQIVKLPLLRRLVFTFVANQAIERIRWRENLRFERTRLFGLVRRLFLELGKRFEQEGILHSKNDIFYLEVEEVLNFVEGKSTTSNLAELAQLRKRESQEFKKELPPPNRIVTRNSVIPATPVATSAGATPVATSVGATPVATSVGATPVATSVGATPVATSAGATPVATSVGATPVATSVGATPCVARPENENLTMSRIARPENAMQGLGCSPGIVRGRVRVVRDPASAKPLEDEILIAERTDPGWIVLFTQAKGIIVEYGSLLSHTAIVSRELGIPAIVSAAGVMDWLSDGDLIEFNGKTGSIKKLESSQESELEAADSSKDLHNNSAEDPAENSIQNSEHDLDASVLILIDSKGLRRAAS